jgi:C1A family cysteine protease
MFFLLFVLSITLTSYSASASEIDISKIQQAIIDNHAHWTAGETSRTRLSLEERRLSMGLLRETRPTTELHKLPPYQDLPSSFSWQDNHGNYITSVKDQGMCGACSYFSTCAAAESWLRIKEGNPRLEIDLSEQFVLSCGNVGSCKNGAFIEHVHQFLANTGAPDEECFPYQESETVPCSEACPDWVDKMVRIGDFIVVTHDPMSIDEIKNAVFHHPVVAGFDVYKDFNTYTGGVYQHVSGDLEGAHAVLVYGWEDSTSSWLCKNSWGPSWGVAGHFRIKWGDSGFGSPVVMIWDVKTDAPALDVRPSRLYHVMRPGEKSRQYLELTNTGTGPLEYIVKTVISTIGGVRAALSPTTYFRVPFGAGTLAAGHWIELPVEIAMDDYTLGTVKGYIEVSTNQDDTILQVPLTVEVQFSEHDIAISDMSTPAFNWPTLLRFSPSVQLKNWGGDVMESTPCQCTILDSTGAEIYTQTVNVDSVPAEGSRNLRFPEYTFIKPGIYKFAFKTTPLNDENQYNNSYAAWIRVHDIVDDFEQENALWNCAGGWGRTDLLSGGHESKYHMHVNHGTLYENNAQADLTLRFPVDLSLYNSAFLNFWTRFMMEKGQDVLYVQASADSQLWTTVDSLSGNNLRWHAHQTDLTRFTGLEYEKVFIRFRFISNESQTGLGPMIDDVRLAVDYLSEARRPSLRNIQDRFNLLPNYPNPFNPVTIIPYQITEPSWIKMTVFNVDGQRIEQVLNKYHAPGHYQFEWNGTAHPSGLYIYKMEITTMDGNSFFLSHKMLLVR